MKWRQRR